MKNSKENLKKICNYIEMNTSFQTSHNISLIEMLSSDDEEFISEKKRKKRELAIDIALGEKKESDWSKEDSDYNIWAKNTDLTTSVISPKIITMTLNLSSHKSYNDVYDFVIDFINQKTKNPKKLANGANSTQFNIKMGLGNYPPDYTESEKLESDLRRIITKINLCSSVVSIEGRMGAAKTVLIGSDNWNYFQDIESRWGGINGLNFIYSDKIDNNKIIVLRNNDKTQPGIILIDNNNNFYIKESPRWDKQFCWFSIS